MVLYNVTVSVDEQIAEEWLEWMTGIHIPQVMATGCFLEYKLFRVINSGAEQQAPTFAVQYFAEDMKTLQQYMARHAQTLRKQSLDKYGESAIAFRTLLEEL